MPKIFFPFYLIMVWLTSFTLPLYAQNTFYYFKELGVKEGLSQSRVQSILSDHRGYLWIGTESGLNCYDRSHLKQYFHHKENVHSLPSNHIRFIAEDSLHTLWIGTDLGICRYNRETDDFTPITNEGKAVHVSSYLPVEDGILFAGSGVIYKYLYSNQKFGILYNASDPSLYIPFWRMIRYDQDHILLNSRWKGIYKFNLKTRELTKSDEFSEKNYTCMYFDSHERLWLSSYGNGIFCYQYGKLIKHFTTENSALNYNVVHDMVEKDNQLWAATDGGGINIINLKDFTFKYIQHRQDDIYSFPANTIYRLYIDPAGSMWAGSIRNGLIGIKEVYARSYKQVPYGNAYGLSNPTINCFYQDDAEYIWVGTDGGGINRFSPFTGEFRHYSSTQEEKIVSIIEYSDHELLYSSFNKGLFIFNKETGQLRPFLLMDQEMNNRTCVDGYSVFAQRISPHELLFSAQHIFVYNQLTKQFKIVASMGEDYERNSPLIIGSSGNTTYLCDLKSICAYDRENESFNTIYKDKQTINDVCIDQEGCFWIATKDGIVHYNPHNHERKDIDTGLFQEATSLMADREGRIWIGTRPQLYIYSTRNNNLTTLSEVDGVCPNEYLFHANLLSRNGDIIMAGTEGMTLIHSDIHFKAEEKYNIELLDILVNGNSVSIASDEKDTIKKLTVPWDFSTLQIKVLLNEEDVFRPNMFRFQIEGLEKEPLLSTSNSVLINHLPAGEYTLTGSYYSRAGEWEQKQSILQIIVTPPWWQTRWFYLLLFFITAICLYALLFIYSRKKKRKQAEEIMRLKHKIYEEKIKFLTNISHELRTPLTLICAPLKRMLHHETETKDIDRQLNSIYKQANQMKNIIDMVLDMRKLEEGKETLHILPHDLDQWAMEIGQKFLLEYEAKGIQLNFRLESKHKEIWFDSSKCEFVLSNFLMNALKFSEAGSTTTLATTYLPEEQRVRISVQDEGVGLGDINTDSLFSNFYQGNHDKGGSGIGLSYAKSLITYHNGKIGAINGTDRGAIFYFELPVSASEHPLSFINNENSSNTIELPTADNIDYEQLKKYSIIIVEDTTDLRHYLKEILSKYFGKVYVAKDGKEGLEQIRNKLPDIIISDVMMPRMNGFELCKEVKTQLDISHIPFILLTAYHNSQNMHIGYKTGADYFLPKPFEVDSLLALIGNLLKLREQIRLKYKDDMALSYKDMSFSNADESFLLKLNGLISENLSNPDLDVNFLASNMCISRSLLFNKIKAITGMGIIDYVNKQRIDRSIVLLNTTSMNLTEISEMVGFSSLRYFSKVFKSIMGEIPSAYRKQEHKER